MKRRPRHTQHQRGLTLLEVLVAFAILSGIVISVLIMIGQNAQYMLSAEDRLFASVAADNLMTETLATAATPGAGDEQGEIEIAGRRFAYDRVIKELGETTVIIELRIFREGDGQTLARATALKETG